MEPLTDREALEKRLKDKITVLDNGCHKWCNETIDPPLTNMKKHDGQRKSILTHKFLYEQYHSAIIVKDLILKRICDTKNCLNPVHFELTDRTKTETKEETWERMMRQTERVDDHIIWIPSNGGIGFRGKTQAAHRVSYIIHKNNMEPIPTHNANGKALVIRHICKVKGCINPHHLEIGTQSENLYDDKLRDGTLNRGEKSHTAKITEELASKIKLSRREKGEPGYKTVKERAEHFGVRYCVVYNIDSGHSWRYIPDKNGKASPDLRERDKQIKDKARIRVWTPEEYEAIIPMLKLQVVYTSENKKDPSVDGDCWEFTGSKDEKNYGRMSYLGVHSRTHILACESKNGRRRKPDEVTRHLCGNHPCCNPEHVKFGTHSENGLDNVKHNGRSILKKEDVLAIRASDEPNAVLGKRYNMGTSYIWQIKKRQKWKHI